LRTSVGVLSAARARAFETEREKNQEPNALSIDVESLKAERDQLKTELRELDVEQRKLEVDIKNLRQKEIRGKREIEALSTLIELHEPRPETPAGTPEPAEPAGA
jgi:predicted  nucleic acid-binding Zn-ribbon protein